MNWFSLLPLSVLQNSCFTFQTSYSCCPSGYRAHLRNSKHEEGVQHVYIFTDSTSQSRASETRCQNWNFRKDYNFRNNNSNSVSISTTGTQLVLGRLTLNIPLWIEVCLWWITDRKSNDLQPRAVNVDLQTDATLQVDISDALSERDKVKFTVHTKVCE